MPRLTVLVVVDQFPAWSFSAREHLFHKGFRRLLDRGLVFTHGTYPYAATYTSAGHAALTTGAPPAVTGILANSWFHRDVAGVRESVEDAAHPHLDVPGAAAPRDPADSASPRLLRVPAVGDALIAAHPAARVVSVALKDRGAVLAAGQRPTLAFWYDPTQVAFTTSTYYARALPAWLATLAREHPLSPRLADPWTPLDAALLERETGAPDDAPGEANVKGFGTTFPHDLRAAEKPAAALNAAPLGNQVVVEAALAAVDGESLGQDDTPDLLIVSFSATDYAGHWFGQESWEALDMHLRLDAQLDELLAGLDARVGEGRYAVVLTSDHGAARVPERTGGGARRIPPPEIEAAAEDAAAAVAGPGDWIAAARDPAIYLSAAARALDQPARERLLDAVLDRVLAIDGIGYAFRSERIAGDCDPRPELEALACRSIDRERSGEILFGPREGSVIMRQPFEATAHGSANPDDRTVPIVIVAPGVAPRREDEPVSMLRVAPTLARLLGVAPPPAAREAPLLP